MEYCTREDCMLAGTSVMRRIAERLGCEVVGGRAFAATEGLRRELNAWVRFYSNERIRTTRA